MGTSKVEIFDVEQNKLAALSKALGHPARIAILQHLLKLDTCVCGEIVNEFDLAQATVSQHLKELKKVGLIKGTIEGTSMCYCIDTDRWKEAKEMLGQFFDAAPDEQSCC